MNRETGMKLLNAFINKITNEYYLQEFVRYVFDNVADGFFEKSASSTGKYYPDFAQGDGGLLRHTLKAAEVWDELWSAYSYKFNEEEIAYSFGLAAVLLHDSCKYDKDFSKEYTLSYHDDLGAEFVGELFDKFSEDKFDGMSTSYIIIVQEIYTTLTDAIASHHGRWSTTRQPQTFFDELIFLSDYVASRKWVKLGAC